MPVPDERAPGNAPALVRAARKAGWKVEVTYARGTWDGNPPRLLSSYAVRMHKAGVAAVAIWHVTDEGKATFHSGLVQGANVPLAKLNYTKLREFIHNEEPANGIQSPPDPAG